MFCRQCGEELQESARFCSGCGLSSSSFGIPSGRAHAQAGDGARLDPLLNQVLDGKYSILERLGTGGMGIVYRAQRVHIGDEVAVKVLHKQLVADTDMLERFRREARAAAQLRHPNIVSIIDLSEARGEDAPAYIVMELIEGESLRALLRREGCLGAERAVALMRDICAGVGMAHRRGIFHRDLKPDDVIVLAPDEDRERETVKVVDFGLAKLKDAASATALTQTGMMVGTPLYMSPEQCRGDVLDARADVYSLGAIMYEMLAGGPPFIAETATGLIAQHLFDSMPPLPKSVGVSAALEAVIARSLAKDRDERQRDATEFARELREAMQTADAIPPTQSSAADVALNRAQSANLPPTQLLDSGNAMQVSAHEPSAPAGPTVASSGWQHLTGEPVSHSQEIVPPAQTMQAQATTTPPAAFYFGDNAAPREKKSRRVPLMVGALLVLLLIAGGVVWLLMNRNRESVKPSSNAAPATANLPRAVKNSIGMEFVLVPAGAFMMGSENGEATEKPVHRVTIGKDFYMGKYEVTQAEWQQVMGNNPSYFKNCDECPADTITWNDAQEFIRRMNAKGDGFTYRLPSEAEWEYACRAGTTGDYAGNLDAMAWYFDNSGDAPMKDSEWSEEKVQANTNHNRSHPVGQKQPNAFGLYDMHGNVWEWCEDVWHGNYQGAPTDGSAWLKGGDPKQRILRGASWYYNAPILRSAYRRSNTPDHQSNGYGLRLVALSQ